MLAKTFLYFRLMYSICFFNHCAFILFKPIIREIFYEFFFKLLQILILSNGNYGDRVAQICDTSGVKNSLIPMSTQALSESLSSKKVHGVFAVHCETSTGKINPVSEMGKIVKEHSAGSRNDLCIMSNFIFYWWVL